MEWFMCSNYYYNNPCLLSIFIVCDAVLWSVNFANSNNSSLLHKRGLITAGNEWGFVTLGKTL